MHLPVGLAPALPGPFFVIRGAIRHQRGAGDGSVRGLVAVAGIQSKEDFGVARAAWWPD